MNKLDKQYQDLLQDILDNGVTKKDRTGTGTISVFGRQIRHKMSDGFPLLTTKKMAWKTMVTELLWFLRGDTNIKYLVDNNCHIWDGDAYKRYEQWDGSGCLYPEELTQEEFINKIKTDDEFAKKWGELGPIYGKQWRSWAKKKMYLSTDGSYENIYDEMDQTVIDQISVLINDLKTNPDSRRLMVNAWNVGELDQMVLPPCHYGFQVYTRELSIEERATIWNNTHNPVGNIYTHNQYDENDIPARTISLMWNQRSVDTFLGLPFNIASYGLLLEIIAKEVNMVPDELIGNLGDTHLYLNHIEQAKEQIGRELTARERTALGSNGSAKLYDTIKDSNYITISADDEMHKVCDEAGVIRHTREPYPLPTLKFNPIFLANLEHKEFDEAINGQVNFELENYQSHPTIKAPLSN
jgi:thymidylate synthase